MHLVLRRGVILAVGAALALAACQAVPEEPARNTISFAHLPRIRLNVAAVEVVPQYRSPMQAPYVEHEFPTPPETAVVRWVRDRLEAGGFAGKAVVYIREASVIRAQQTDVPFLLGTERLRARVSMMLEVRDRDGVPQHEIKVEAERARNVKPNLGGPDRDRVYVTLVRDLMNDLDVALEQQIRTSWRQYLLAPLSAVEPPRPALGLSAGATSTHSHMAAEFGSFVPSARSPGSARRRTGGLETAIGRG
ncbi:MAG: hypothetical protein HY521_01120 [Proteobacteria bacterium]|nr:hypothetical protein [Pseudomonadota bacterium]